MKQLLDYKNKWQWRIANEKCLVFLRNYNSHWKSTQNKRYTMNRYDLPCMSHIRDFGVTVDSSLNFYQHISIIVHKAHQHAHLILHCFQSRDRPL